MCHSEPGNLAHNVPVFWRHFVIIFEECISFLQFGEGLHDQEYAICISCLSIEL